MVHERSLVLLQHGGGFSLRHERTYVRARRRSVRVVVGALLLVVSAARVVVGALLLVVSVARLRREATEATAPGAAR